MDFVGYPVKSQDFLNTDLPKNVIGHDGGSTGNHNFLKKDLEE